MVGLSAARTRAWRLAEASKLALPRLRLRLPPTCGPGLLSQNPGKIPPPVHKCGRDGGGCTDADGAFRFSDGHGSGSCQDQRHGSGLCD